MNQATEPWQVNLSKIEDLLKILFSTLNTHQDLLTANMAYDRNFMDLIRSAQKGLLAISGSDVINIKPSSGWSCRFVDADNYGYSEKKLDKLRTLLCSKVTILNKKDFGDPFDINEDLTVLKIRSKNDKDFKKSVTALIILSPFIYNHKGSAVSEDLTLNTVREQVGRLNPMELENKYTDFFPDFLVPLFTGASESRGMGKVYEAVVNVQNNFVPKEVIPAVTLVSKGNKKLTERSITMYEVPKPFGIFRGMIGRDCSMVTIPFFALSEKAHVYWIWKEEKRTDELIQKVPAGYAFVIEGNESIPPYLVTINGMTLTRSDTKAICVMFSRVYDCSKLTICSDLTMASVINSRVVGDTLLEYKKDALKVDMPADWHAWSDYCSRTTYMDNYYSQSRLEQAQFMDVPDQAFIVSHSKQQDLLLYHDPGDLGEYALLERAKIGEYATRSFTDAGDQSHIYSLLKIETKHIELIKQFLGAHNRAYISPDLFNEMESVFNINLHDLLYFKSNELVLNSIQDLYQAIKPSPTDADWAYVVNKSNERVKSGVEELTAAGGYQKDKLNDILSRKMSLPDVYIPNYWEENRAFLLFPDGNPYYYRINRYVRYFTSRPVTLNFLTFLKDYPEVVESVNPGDPGWISFLSSAYKHHPEHNSLSGFLNIIFLNRLKADQFESDYYFAECIISYLMVVGDNGYSKAIDFIQAAEKDRLNETLTYAERHLDKIGRKGEKIIHRLKAGSNYEDTC